MKNLILFLSLMFTVVQLGNSQFSLRPQIGVNSPSISDNLNVGDWGNSVGYQFGLDLQFGGVLYIQPGLNYETFNLSVEKVGDIRVSNINVPVLIGYNLGTEDNALGYRLFAGPNFTLHVDEDIDDVIMDIGPKDFKFFRMSGIAGAGLDLSIIFVDAAYSFGLTNWIEGEAIEAKKNSFLINVGVRLGFK